MKFFKFFYAFFLCLPFLIFTYLKPVVYDGTSTIVYKTVNTVFRGGDTANGEVLFKAGITVLGNAAAKLNITTPLFGPIDLRVTGTLDLQNDLILDSLTTLSNGGIIRGSGHSIFLTGDLTIPASTIFTFTGNTVVDGQGHDLIFGKYAQLVLEGGISVTFRNMVIRDVLSTANTPQIRCVDWYGNVCFDDVIFALNDDFVFRNGQFFIHDDVEFTGTSKFSYRSVRPSYIEQHSNLIFSPNTTFEYYPSSTNNSLIKMMDKTSAIIFDGSTLQSTHTGVRFTVGSVYFDDKVTLSSADITMFASVGTGININTGTPATLPIAWSPDGRFFVLGNYNQISTFYRFNGSSFTLLGNVDASSYFTYSLAWSPNGKYLVLGNNTTNPSRLYRFDGTSFTYLRYVDSSAYNTFSVAWSPDGKYLVLGNNGQASKCYRFKGTSFTYMFDVDSAYNTYFAAWSPDGKYLVLGNYGQASRLYRFNGSSFSFISNVDSTAYNTRWVSWSPDGKYLILANNGAISKCYMFNGSSITYLADIGSTYDTTSVAWSPDGRYVALGIWSGTLSKLYRFNGSSFTYLTDIGSDNSIQSVVWNPDGKFLALGKDSSISKAYPVNFIFNTSPQGFVNGIIFGNSALGSSQDLDVNLMSGANVQIYGQCWYDNVS